MDQEMDMPTTTTDPATTTASGPPAMMDPETVAKWKAYIAAAEKRRKQLIEVWSDNVDYRVMKPFGGSLGTSNTALSDRVAISEDWARTKQKTAQLSFQVPKIVAKALRPEFEASAGLVTAAVNNTLTRDCRASYVIDEVLADVINASGLMIARMGIDRRTETKQQQIPRPPVGLDPLTNQPIPDPQGPETVDVEVLVSQTYTMDRISPSMFLWPQEFIGSDWDKASWLGHQSYIPLVVAKKTYPTLPTDFKSTGSKPVLMSKDLVNPQGALEAAAEDFVKVTELWYYASQFDAEKIHPHCIRRIVFVEGFDQPVEHEDTDWQVWVDAVPEEPATPEVPAGQDPATGQPTPAQPARPARPAIPGHYLGITKLPIRVATLTYVSDIATPPSDSGASRPQVSELIRSRSQMLRQRDHSLPIRWYDTNRLDNDVIESLRQGNWQDLIPINGPGDRAVGEVARAAFPRENFEFQRVITADLDRGWALSNASLGAMNPGERSASEVNQVASATAVRLDYEKGRVNRFVAESAAVLFSLMQRWQDFTTYVAVIGPNGAERLMEVNQTTLAGDYMFDFRVDSSDRVDLQTQQANIVKAYNLLANSTSVNRPAIEAEIFALHGYDPAKFTVPPPPPAPERPNVSYRFGGPDLLNAIALAIILKTETISPDDIKNAKMMIQDAVAGMPPIPGTPEANAIESAGQKALNDAAAPIPQPDVEPPDVNTPILKRTENGDRLT